MSWCPIFPQITASSVWSLPPHIFKAWIAILTHKDHESHIWRGNPHTLAKLASITLEQSRESVLVLSSPDEGSLSQEQDGRRIVSDDGEHWFVVNGEKYQEMIKREIAKENARQRTAKWRAGKKHVDSNGSDPIPETTRRHESARPILHYLNEKSGRLHRENENNLGKIGARLAEPEVTPDGIRMMIDRQVALWRGDPKMDRFLTVDTLFGPENFEKYWASRMIPAVSTPTPKTKPIAV